MALEKGLLRWLRHLLRQVVRHHAISILMIGGPAISPVRYSPGRRKRECGWRISPLEGMHFRVVSPPTADGLLPTLIYYHGGCFVSGGFATHDNQLRQLALVQWVPGDRRAVSSGPGVPFSGGAR